LADRVTSSFVFVVGGDEAHGRVQPHGVVLGSTAIELQGELTGVADLLQVRPLALDVPEQSLDPRLVGRLSGLGLSI